MNRLPLTLILAFCAVCELLLNRVALRLVALGGVRASWVQLVDLGGLFFFYLTGLLALGMFTWSSMVLIRDRELFGLPARVLMAGLMALFLPMAAAGLFVGMPDAYAAHLNSSFILLCLGMLIGLLSRPAPIRAKLGLFYLVVPLLLHGYWLLTQQVPALAPTGKLVDLPTRVYMASENLAVLGALAMFLFFSPLPRRSNISSPIPLMAGVLSCAAMGLLSYFFPSRVSQLVHLGLGFNLPPISTAAILHLVALFFFVVTVVSLALRRGPSRDLALGLILVATSGFYLQLPYQLLLTLVGLLTIIRAAIAMRPGMEPTSPQEFRGQGCTDQQWRAYMDHLADQCADGADGAEAVVVNTEEHQISQVRGARGGLPFVLRFVRSGGELEQMDLSMGEPVRGRAVASLSRRRGSRGGRIWRRGAGRRVVSGEAAFDSAVAAHDRSGALAGLLAQAPIRLELQHHLHGWLGLWPTEGLRYVSRPGADSWPVPVAEIAFDPEGADVSALLGLLNLGRLLLTSAP